MSEISTGGLVSAEIPTAAAPAAVTVAPPAAAPEWLPADAWDATTGNVKIDALKPLVEAKAALDAKAAARPEAADEYALALPEDFKLPDGMEFKIEATGDVATEFKTFAHEAGLSQADVSRLLSIFAKAEGAKFAAAQAAQAAETEKLTGELRTLGENGTSRIQAAVGFLEKVLPGVHFSTSSAAGVKAVEALMQRLADAAPPGGGEAALSPANVAARLFPSMKA